MMIPTTLVTTSRNESKLKTGSRAGLRRRRYIGLFADLFPEPAAPARVLLHPLLALRTRSLSRYSLGSSVGAGFPGAEKRGSRSAGRRGGFGSAVADDRA